jgi:hypothetical protein
MLLTLFSVPFCSIVSSQHDSINSFLDRILLFFLKKSLDSSCLFTNSPPKSFCLVDNAPQLNPLSEIRDRTSDSGSAHHWAYLLGGVFKFRTVFYHFRQNA